MNSGNGKVHTRGVKLSRRNFLAKSGQHDAYRVRDGLSALLRDHRREISALDELIDGGKLAVKL